MIRPRAAQRHLAIRRAGGDQKCCRFDAVGNHFMLCAVQFCHAGDRDGWAAGAGNVRAHRIQKKGEIHHLRFARRAFDDGDAVAERRRHHHVCRPQNRRAGAAAEKHRIADNFFYRRINVAAFNFYFRAQRLKTFQMQIDWPRADDAAAGQGNPRFPQPRQQRAGDAD